MKTNEEKTILNEEKTLVKEVPEQKKKLAETGSKKNADVWKSVLVGGVPGIIFGVAGTLVTENVASAADESHEEEISNSTVGGGSAAAPVHDVAPVATEVNDSMSFSEAFAAARAEVGAGGVFSWHGQVYGTYYKPEWDAMSDEQRHEYSQSVAQANVHPEPYTPQPSDPPIVEQETQTAEDHGVQTQEATDTQTHEADSSTDAEEELEVEIIGVTQVEDEAGEVHDVGVGSVGGHGATFLDLEGDGEVDTIFIDENDNGEVDDGEVYDAGESGISMSDLVAQADYGGVAPDDGLYDGMPDYANDADMSSFM